MATVEYLSAVIEALHVMESVMSDVLGVLDEARQRGEWLRPEWKALAKESVRLAHRCTRLAEVVHQVKQRF